MTVVIQQKFIKALPTDNPYCSPEYIDVLKQTLKHRPDLLKAYLEGDWDAFEANNQVILGKWIEAAYIRRKKDWPYIKKFIVIDCARFGDDETVIALMENTDIKEKEVMPFCRHQDISGRAAALSYQNEDCEIVVESVGSDIGAAVIDDLVEMGKDVIQFNPALPSTKPKEYYSLRCESWHNAAKVLSDGIIDGIIVCITKNDPEIDQNYGMDTTMYGQLCTPNYKWRSGKLVVEPKSDTKQRLGRSPDHGDVYMIALWAFPSVSVKKVNDKRERSRNIKDPMMM